MRSHHRGPVILRRALFPLYSILLLLTVAGCGREAPNAPVLSNSYSLGARLAPGAAPTGAFFPLAIGNRWHAAAENRLRFEPIGGGAPIEEFIVQEDITRVLIGTEMLFGRSYTVEEETTIETGSPGESEPRTIVNWIRYRQDASGLYEADVALNEPPVPDGSAIPVASAKVEEATAGALRPFPAGLAARLPEAERVAYNAAWSRLQARIASVRSFVHAATAGGPPSGLVPGEITRLRYPLHPQAEWVIRPAPLFSSTVEAAEVLDLPAGRFPAWRIRLDSQLFGPGDSAHIWFGRSGQLALRYNLISVATDLDGNEIGRVVAEWDEALNDLALVRP